MWHRIRDWWRSGGTHWFNMLSVVAFIFGIYQWAQSEVEIDPTLIVDPQRTVLIERDRVKDAPMRVVRTDGTPIERGVTGVRVYFWNDGRKPMQRAEILEPFRLMVKEPAEILDFRVVKSSRANITQLAVQRVENSNNQLSLDYRVLERSEGLALQLVIAGDPEATIRMEGAALGAQTVTDTDSARSKHFWRWSVTGGLPWLATSAATLVVFILGIVAGKRYTISRRLDSEWLKAIKVTRETSTVATVLTLNYDDVLSGKNAVQKELSLQLLGQLVGFAAGLLAIVVALGAANINGRGAQWVLDLVPETLLDKPTPKH